MRYIFLSFFLIHNFAYTMDTFKFCSSLHAFKPSINTKFYTPIIGLKTSESFGSFRMISHLTDPKKLFELRINHLERNLKKENKALNTLKKEIKNNSVDSDCRVKKMLVEQSIKDRKLSIEDQIFRLKLELQKKS